ncbi:MAG: hypothetical protein JKY02_00155 [Flavobacteriaceae bacterium]|nr:hypothetical protein [Flavobacteriaceae bacterium]
MNPKRNVRSIKKLILFSCIGSLVLLSSCKYNTFEPLVEIDYTKYNPPHDVVSQNEDASLTELAEFAWQEFIALNWPAKSGSRGLPDKTLTNGFVTASKMGSTVDYTPVWQTYWHRNELFPDPTVASTPIEPSTSDSTLPLYQYSNVYDFDGSGTGDYTLWNNLDEINELGEDVVFAHSTTSAVESEYQVLYEAKMNYDGASYVYNNKLYDETTRTRLQSNTKNKLSANGVCGADPTKYICLPCGDLNSGGSQGNIEIKAAWRKLTPTEMSANSYHTKKVIYYVYKKEANGTIKPYYKNAVMGLVGLHIIHKTKTFPDYVFATWEHKDNLSSGIVYEEKETTPFGDNKDSTVAITRDHPIPTEIMVVNDTVSKYLKTNKSVWHNYKLINVQAKPNDVSALVGSHTNVDNSYFYLSNSVIESNVELQTFTGSLTDPNVDNVIYKQNKINMGGCMGCHGNAQAAGTDFNFLIAAAPFSVPEFTGTDPGCPSGGVAFPINNWLDVKKFFNLCVVQTSIGNSPHQKFWEMSGKTDKENHKYFITKTVPGVGVRICIPGNGAGSNIIKYLKMGVGGTPRMPGEGPYFTAAQIKELEKWIDNNCPYL